MSSEHLRRARAIFLDLLELPPDQRTDALDAACGDDAALRHEVASLLEVESRSSDLPPPLLGHETPDDVEATIGPYRLSRKLGEGGFADVYLAEQTSPFRRQVAMKIMKLGLDTRALLARFDAERQILASLDHPNIAKIHDAGATDRGRPYFVMELVGGRRITDYCDDRQLSLRDRLVLFTMVCRAVQHAHQRGIIHRDLKPSNVLVATADDRPVPKVIDFGVAKAMGSALAEHTFVTSKGQLIGTPAYMSPEQADIDAYDIDVRTDVYSLGVVLYELLVGAPPFEPQRLREASLTRAIDIIRHEEPPRPSVRVGGARDDARIARVRGVASTRRLSRELRGDLDWIVLRALEKDRSRRYDSVDAFAADIERYLDDRPVEAGPPSVAYRLRKFARRHRTAVSVALVVFASILFALFESNRQRLAAERALDEAEAVTAFLEDMLQSVDPRGRGADTPVREVLDEGAVSASEEFADRPLLLARLLQTMGLAYFHLGEMSEAERLTAEALALRESLLAPDDVDVALARNRLGLVRHHQGRYADADELYRDALAIWRAREGSEGSNVAAALNNLANNFSNMGEVESTRVYLLKALEIREKVYGPEHQEVSESLNDLGALGFQTGDHERALEYLTRSLELAEKLHGPDHPDVAQRLTNLAVIRYQLADYDAAERDLVRALAIQEHTLGSNHPELAITLLNLSAVRLERNDTAGARDVLVRARSIQETQLGPTHPDVAATLANLAEVEHREGRSVEARRLATRGLDILRGADLLNTADASAVYSTLGRLELEAGDPASAVTFTDQALAILERLVGDESPLLVPDLEQLGRALRRLGRDAEADSVTAHARALGGPR